jgi:hypothetical protein
LASAPGFAEAASGAGGGAPRLPCCANAAVGAVTETTPKRHRGATNFENEKNLAEIMPQILHTYRDTSRNPDKYFCILTTRTSFGD